MTYKRRTCNSSLWQQNLARRRPTNGVKYDKALKAEAIRLAGESCSTQAAAQQLGISPQLLRRWQQIKLVAEVSSKEMTCHPQVRALRARLKRVAQELDMLKKPWSSSASRRVEHLRAHRPTRGPCSCASSAGYYA